MRVLCSAESICAVSRMCMVLLQVHSICQYGDIKLKSDKTSITISTYPLPQASEQGKSLVILSVSACAFCLSCVWI
jgi:hypothetical protein